MTAHSVCKVALLQDYEILENFTLLGCMIFIVCTYVFNAVVYQIRIFPNTYMVCHLVPKTRIQTKNVAQLSRSEVSR